ncbi:unnamed protein product [Paramecium sonneborni]|uniref:Uncharacterized protein n=1 Tax=Paramecium sonneborni TaxID=65129 RepID=A0A8S1RT57_9CILI|nr:unnamed protein product [Paramecium sonneborni]
MNSQNRNLKQEWKGIFNRRGRFARLEIIIKRDNNPELFKHVKIKTEDRYTLKMQCFQSNNIKEQYQRMIINLIRKNN